MVSRRQAAAVVAFAVVALVAGAIRAATWFDNKTLAVWVFDVGQGDAIFVDGPDKQILIDGGPGSTILENLGDVMLPWDRSIDLMIATHPHADHIGGLDAVLTRYRVDEVIDNGLLYDSAAESAFEELAEEEKIIGSAGMTWDLGRGATLEILWPPEPMDGEVRENVHDGNIVAVLTYGETTMLLTGDAEAEQEAGFVDTPPLGGGAGGGVNTLGHIDILKVGHHGSDTSTSQVLLDAITPDYAIISVGEGNDYGHPSMLVVDRLLRSGAQVFRTDLQGDIRIISKGGEPTVRAMW